MTVPTPDARPGPVLAQVDPDIFDCFPDYRRTVLTCTAGAAVEHRDAMAAALAAAARGWADRDVAAEPVIEQWRAAFKRAGISTRKYRPSPEALLRRAARGDDLGSGHTLVDLGCAVTLSTGLPVGVHTVNDAIAAGGLRLRRAGGTETFTTLGGDVERPDPDEVIYTSAATVLTRRWVWRQGAHGSVTGPGPWRLAVNVDSLDRTSDEAAADVIIGLLADCGVTDVGHHVLDAAHPAANLTW